MNYKNIRNQIRGKSNRATGEMFENYISSACIHYELTGQAIIEKTPEPMRVVRNIGGGRFTAVFEKKAQPDYKGTLKGGQTIVFEAKHTESKKIQQSRVTDVQEDRLNKYESMGAKCYVIVSMGMQTFHLVPWEVWRNMKEIYNRKYVTIKELDKYKVPFKGGVVRFLSHFEN